MSTPESELKYTPQSAEKDAEAPATLIKEDPVDNDTVAVKTELPDDQPSEDVTIDNGTVAVKTELPDDQPSKDVTINNGAVAVKTESPDDQPSKDVTIDNGAVAVKTESPDDQPSKDVTIDNGAVAVKTESPDDQPSEDVTMDDNESEKMLRAARQIEFYFADSNLPYDRFMWQLYTANPEHWVPISTVVSFKRMREYKAFGDEWIIKSLKLSEELEVDETNTKVRRRSEVQEPKGQFERSIYAKGFGKEDPSLQGKLERFFEQYGKTNAVRMRRMDRTKEFKGSVFVEFTDFKSVDAFLTADPKPSWEGEELLVMSKGAYCDMKIKEKGITGKAAALRKENMNGGGRKGFNAFREMQRANSGGDKGAKGSKDEDKPAPEIFLEFLGSKIRVYDEDGGTIKEEEVPFVKSATLKFEGCGSNVHFTSLKEPLKERFTRTPFIKYKTGNDWGLIGFDKTLSEEDSQFVKDTLKTIGSKEVTWSVPEEEEEKAFQIERAKTAAKAALGNSKHGRDSSRGGRGGRGRGGRGGRGRGNSRGSRNGGRDREDRKDSKEQGGSGETGEKRKRAVEPDGGPDVGTRGVGVPTISSTKKSKTDETAVAAS